MANCFDSNGTRIICTIVVKCSLSSIPHPFDAINGCAVAKSAVDLQA